MSSQAACQNQLEAGAAYACLKAHDALDSAMFGCAVMLEAPGELATRVESVQCVHCRYWLVQFTRALRTLALLSSREPSMYVAPCTPLCTNSFCTHVVLVGASSM